MFVQHPFTNCREFVVTFSQNGFGVEGFLDQDESFEGKSHHRKSCRIDGATQC